MTDKKENLLHLLAEASGAVSGPALAQRLGVSERSIRNYIRLINNDGIYQIRADRNGYRLVQKPSSVQSSDHNELQERTYHVLSELLSKSEGVSAFDAADELSVSESTIMNQVIPEIRSIVKDFNIRIESKNYVYHLSGSERDKRKLIGHLVSNNSYGFFSSSETLQKLFPEFDVKDVLHGLYNITQQSGLFLNNYALNNLLIHLMVILLRLKSEDTLPAADPSETLSAFLEEFVQKDEILKAANQISLYFIENYGVTIPEEDFRQIVFLIALSIDHGQSDLKQVMEKEFTDSVFDLLKKLRARYDTPEFSKEFAMQFSLHMYQARQRSAYHISYPNPIGTQIKKDYALVYDMAVYFSHQFSLMYDADLSEDEIAFIAFHIGAYLENNHRDLSGISCIIVVENYHSFSAQMVSTIRSIYNSEISSLNVYPLDRYLFLKPEAQLLITTIRIPVSHPHQLLVDPILTKQNIIDIWSELQKIQDEKRKGESIQFLKSLLHPSLFFRNIPFCNKQECIEFLGRKCEEEGYINAAFIQDVLLRESVSSTAFTDCLAVPHTISQNADRSFICVVHDDSPIPWGKKNVNFVLMIGITAEDMKYFKNSFEIIIDRFYSTESAEMLLKTDTFEEFVGKLTEEGY
ncbi:BglG family transcription antiterminator [Anaerolactibacter massiliensis]|uniref:BglG family transcription antiterminator n=1 Tax=Anaerolactibacter massiliensis TaxID=2044573 RepID=UPI000CF993CD|nr:PTS sugar transporter subunit IIA [Anaerolactibacter massiliensis]